MKKKIQTFQETLQRAKQRMKKRRGEFMQKKKDVFEAYCESKDKREEVDVVAKTISGSFFRVAEKVLEQRNIPKIVALKEEN